MGGRRRDPRLLHLRLKKLRLIDLFLAQILAGINQLDVDATAVSGLCEELLRLVQVEDAHLLEFPTE